MIPQELDVKKNAKEFETWCKWKRSITQKESTSIRSVKLGLSCKERKSVLQSPVTDDLIVVCCQCSTVSVLQNQRKFIHQHTVTSRQDGSAPFMTAANRIMIKADNSDTQFS